MFAGCIIPKSSEETPADLEIRYSYGACKAEWGRTNIFLYSNGSGIYESGSGPLDGLGKFEKQEFNKKINLNESELRELLEKIDQSGFYSLAENYADLGIHDGSCSFISVTKNNITKMVSIANMKPPNAYSKVADLIYSTMEK